METTRLTHVEVDGHPAGADDLRHLALANDGHLTTLQARAGRTRGLALHLKRLDHANQELYGVFLDGELVRERIRHALTTAPPPDGHTEPGDATVRVVVFPTGPGAVSILVSIGPPAEPAAGPLRLCSVRYQRPLAHLKHVGSFAQIHFGRLARARGFDDALLITSDGLVCETTVGNIGFLDDAGEVIWPDAPALTGVTMSLLERSLLERPLPERPLPERPLPEQCQEPRDGDGDGRGGGARRGGPGSRHGQVRVSDVPRFRGAFVTNSRGISPVDRIDTMTVPVDPAAMDAVRRAYLAVPWDEI